LNEIDEYHESSKDHINVSLLHEFEVDLEELAAEGLLEGLTHILTLLSVGILIRVNCLVHILFFS
jgi:hypothetical protein